MNKDKAKKPDKHITWNCVYFYTDISIVWSIQDTIDYYVAEKVEQEMIENMDLTID
jgi:hypothetical protein